MDSSITEKSLSERTETVFKQDLERNYARTDRMFAGLMLAQWAIAFILALVVSPLTWSGTESSVHQHVYAALFFGGAITLFPVFLAWKFPGTALTRHVIAISQLLMSGLLIHITGGRTTTHFHIFGSLAFLAFYRDWRVLITATLVTALDHLFRGVWYPQSIFGQATGSIMMALEHATYVIFEDIFLILGCFHAVKEMHSTAAKQAQAEFAGLELEKEKASAETSAREAEQQKVYLSENAARMLFEMDKFADGDLRVKLLKEKDDEMGKLIEGFNRAVAKTGALLRQMVEAVNTTADAAGQINASTEHLAGSAREQLAQARHASATMEEMTRAARESSEVVRLTAAAVNEGGESAARGKKVVGEAVSKMNQIAEVVRNSTATVERLGSSSNEIGKIVSVINDIARQTNLLALNAAVEAARAGEQGAGFAVVAGEVRNLAIRTTEATSQINEVITSIQHETAQAISAMRLGSREVEEGINLSNTTSQALDQIVSATEGMIERVNQVVSVSEEQAASSLKVTANVQTISDAATQSASSVEEIADSIHQLNQLTEDLRAITSQFKLETNQTDSKLETNRRLSAANGSAARVYA